MSADDTQRLLEVLLRGRNSDGGWGYYPAKSSRLEPTAWATLALLTAGEDASVLGEWPSTADGLLVERTGGTPNHAFHGLALLALFASGTEHRRGNGSLVKALQHVKGIALKPTQNSGQDNSLRAWSWIAGTFSWVEPTAWCLLTLKKWARIADTDVDRRRLEDAERLLFNRSCVTGGWNYGNADVLGKQLRAYVPTTAIALLSMQDRQDHPIVQRSVDFLESHATAERSGNALGLASLALSAHRRHHDAVRAALVEQLSTTIEMRNHAAVAIACCALRAESAHAAFTL